MRQGIIRKPTKVFWNRLNLKRVFEMVTFNFFRCFYAEFRQFYIIINFFQICELKIYFRLNAELFSRRWQTQNAWSNVELPARNPACSSALLSAYSRSFLTLRIFPYIRLGVPFFLKSFVPASFIP